MRIKDITGERFGALLVVERTKRTDPKGRAFWKCKCLGCGRFIEVRGDNLRSGRSEKCCWCNGGCGKGSVEV